MPAEMHSPIEVIGTQEEFIEKMKSEYKHRGWAIALLEKAEGICLMNRGNYTVGYWEIKRKDIKDRTAIIKVAHDTGIDVSNLIEEFDERGERIDRPWL